MARESIDLPYNSELRCRRNSLSKENFFHLIFLSYPVYNINKMQDLILKTTFIIVRIVFKPQNNDAYTTKTANKIVFLQEQQALKRTESPIK